MKEIEYPKIEGVTVARLKRLITQIIKMQEKIGEITRWTDRGSPQCPVLSFAPRYDRSKRQIDCFERDGAWYTGTKSAREKRYYLYTKRDSEWWQDLNVTTRIKINRWLKTFPWK